MSDKLDEVAPRIKVKEGESSEKLLEEKGILFRHAEQIKECNRGLKWIIMLRPINKEVAGKLKSGARGKIISIKGKSSEFIFLAGDVPYKAELSKLGKNGKDSDWDKITHFNSVNKKSIEDSDNEKVKRKQQVIEKKQEIEERKQKIEERKQKIKGRERKIKEHEQQIEDFRKGIEVLNNLLSDNSIQTQLIQENNIKKTRVELETKQQELEKEQKELEKEQKELEKEQKELTAEQQTLERYIQKFNLSFKLNKIQKTVEIGGETYKCFYKVGENERPEYENTNELGIQPVIYIKDKNNNYFKVEYDNSKRGWNIDKNNPQKIDTKTKSIKKLKIFSYEQYEKCAVDGENRIRVDDTTEDVFKVAEYYKTKNEPKQFFIKAKKEGDKEFKYYPLTKIGTLAGQNNITTYKINSKFNMSFGVAIEKLDTTYELINPPLTADYDQLSAARVYEDKEKVSDHNLTNLESVVKYLQEEQEKLISFPADKYLKKCKNAAERLAKKDFSKKEKDLELIQDFLDKKSDISSDNILSQESDILQLKLGLLGCCGESVTKEKLKIGKILGYGISHGLEILHYPPEPINYDNKGPDEEFLVIDGEGNPRIAKNLEGVLFFMNDQRNKGICCLEPNPLWPIKINLDKSPHEIQVDENSNSPLLINGFYTGIVELQKELKMKPFTDKFMYAERLMLNSDFVPNIKLPDDVEKEDVRMEIEANNLIEAYEYYEYALKGLKSLKEKVKEKKYDENFIKFCQEQRLSDLETNDVVLGILKNNDEVRSYFNNNQNIKFLVEKLKAGEQIKEETVNENIRNEVTKILMNDKIKGMLLSKPDNCDLKAKIFDVLPNINLLKGFEIEEKIKSKKSETQDEPETENKSKNFLDCLDNYVNLIQNRQSQIEKKFDKIEIYTKITNKKINKKKQLDERMTNINRKIESLKEECKISKDERDYYYNDKLEKAKTKIKKLEDSANYWQQKILKERENMAKGIKTIQLVDK